MPLLRRPGLMGARIGRPGLLGTAARTAVIAGTASSVSGAVQRRQAERAYEREQEQEPAQMPEPVAPAPAAASPADQRLTQLRELAELRQQGVLTEAEFESQKAAILAGR